MASNRLLTSRMWFAVAFAAFSFASPAHAYVDLAPTLTKVMSDAKQIGIVEVVSYDSKTHVLTLKETEALKGQEVTEMLTHDVSATDSSLVPRAVLQWAEPGAHAVIFMSRTTALVCVGSGWYQAKKSEGKWLLGPERPDLPLAYFGSVAHLENSVKEILGGKTTIITTVPHGATEGASFDIALNRANIPALAKVQRLRADATMPGNVLGVSANPAYLLGQGPMDPKDVPAKTAALSSTDPGVRADAANDLRTLGKAAAPAADALQGLLKDNVPAVRFAAAAALAHIAPKTNGLAAVFQEGLESTDTSTRRDAAFATGFAAPIAKPLAPLLAKLIEDPEESVRIATLQSIAAIGPDAAVAAPGVKKLIEDPSLAVDAADALGRIGPAAQPAPAALLKMLDSPEASIRWTAVRDLSQIGGPEAKPAVDYMIKELPHASEVDGYNMMVYLALLGPVAKPAIPAVRSAPIKNPVLPAATVWAIEPDKSFPWLNQNGGRGFGGPGGGGGGGGPMDMGTMIYEAYVHELGSRLKPAAIALAKRIMAGTDGNTPAWGYEILNTAPNEVVTLLVPYLKDSDLATRERAAVALGKMGANAASAKVEVQQAVAAASTERERRLLQWSLDELAAD